MSEQEPLSFFQSKVWLNILKYVKNLSIMLLAVSGIFMVFNWPFRSELLIVGFASIMYYCFVRNLGQKPIVQVLSICWGIFFMGICFKIMHWPWANILLLIGGVGAMIQSLLSILTPVEASESTGGFFDSKTFKNVIKFTTGLSKVVSILGIVFFSFRWSGSSEILIVGISSLSLTYLLSCLSSSTLGQKLHGIGWSVTLIGLALLILSIVEASVSLSTLSAVGRAISSSGIIFPIGCVLLIVYSLLAVLTPIEE
ncbi:hypothetical protein N8203_03880 [Crocinitomicaceae bacterium]|nr:hypothetical protein [Crocinitomicaceae bacterium]